jgi:putative hemolysin
MELIQASDLVKAVKLEKLGGENTARILMSLLQFDKINQLYARHYEKEADEFIHSVLVDIGIKYHGFATDLTRIPDKGGFILIANHPFGGIEGLILLDALSKKRPDLKVMANFLFNWITPIKNKFFAVNPFETHKDAYSSFHGLKSAFAHVHAGCPLIIFPAGEVSTYQPNSKIVADRPWNKSILRFIKNAGVPVIPAYFHGSNSWLFHAMGRVHPLLRTIKIPSELLNKQSETILFKIGNRILAKEIEEYFDTKKLEQYLRAKIYALANVFEPGNALRPKTIQLEEPVTTAVNADILAREIDKITPRHQLFQWQNFGVYCAPSFVIPGITAEIGRLREITFREVGEGTKQSSDLDNFDVYYHQLFIWDEEQQRIVGGYRIGKGKDIVNLYGLKGFYTQTLFRMDKEMLPVLSESIELGRSFIVKDYQRKPMSLFLLWKGILYFLQENESYNYLVGPVSISNSYTRLSQEIMIGYIKEHHYHTTLARYIKPRKPFFSRPSSVDTGILIERVSSLQALDQVIKEVEPSGSKMPVLLRKYLDLGGKIAGFNIDPKFSNTVDGLLILDLNLVKPEIVQALAKEDVGTGPR